MRDTKRVVAGLLWVGPNLLGFAAFTAIPLAVSLWMAFSDWNLTRHNFLIEQQLGAAYRSPAFVGFSNFSALLSENRFWTYLGNTLFLMMVIPFNIAGSLILALLLTKPGNAGGGKAYSILITALLALGATVVLVMLGMRVEAMVLLLGVTFTGVLAMGAFGRSTVYRTFFYLPHFTAGVAVFLLWKRLYSVSGPINNALVKPVEQLESLSQATPSVVVVGVTWVLLAAAGVVMVRGLGRLRRMWSDGDLGTGAMACAFYMMALPAMLGMLWFSPAGLSFGVAGLLVSVGAAAIYQLVKMKDGRFTGVKIGGFEGLGSAFMSSMMGFVLALVLIGLAAWVHGLPGLARSKVGLNPPDWLNSITWAKPALMIMAFWTAVGSNNMLLYVAGLSNIPPELYEAADIDGASGMQRFWNITWPQLAPTTFFIFIMSIIGGLQGGFESARVMTEGGAGTTSLSYFIYTSAFMDLSLGMGSAIAWVLFGMVLLVTLFNWKVGNQYVND